MRRSSARELTVTEIILGRCRFGNECLNLHEGPSKVSGATKKKRTVKVEKSPDRSKMPMKTALDVIKRIQWDEMMPPESFTIGYLDRFIGLVEDEFSKFSNWGNLVSLKSFKWHKYIFFLAKLDMLFLLVRSRL